MTEVTLIRGGNIFDSPLQTITNPINCAGAMGAGLALQFKRRFPEMFGDYVRRCAAGLVKPGEPYLWRGERRILNFPTKRHWRDPSDIRFVADGLAYLTGAGREITSLAVPALGCGLGGLAWEDVLPVLKRGLAELGVPAEIYAPVTA